MGKEDRKLPRKMNVEIVEKSICMERRRLSISKPREEQIPKLRKLWKEAFGDTDDFLDGFYKTAFDKERCRCVIIDGEVAAALYWFDCDIKEENVAADTSQTDLQAASLELLQTDLRSAEVSGDVVSEKRNHRIAYIYAVATAKKFQGQRICHKLMEETHKYLRECGYEGVILVPGSEELFRFYEGIGYRICSYIREFQCVAEPKNISFEQIDMETYAMLRREYLPKGGVVQEKENLDFLKMQACFYAGEDFVLAARKEGDILRGLEFLGNEKVAPAAVHALGCKEGYFRVLAKTEWSITDDGCQRIVPFGMYYPLTEHYKMPKYFGLSFD